MSAPLRKRLDWLRRREMTRWARSAHFLRRSACSVGAGRSSHFESVLLGAPHVPERAGCDADNGMRMMVPTRAKPDEIVPELSVQKRVLLYCIASGTPRRRAGVTRATAQTRARPERSG